MNVNECHKITFVYYQTNLIKVIHLPQSFGYLYKKNPQMNQPTL